MKKDKIKFNDASSHLITQQEFDALTPAQRKQWEENESRIYKQLMKEGKIIEALARGLKISPDQFKDQVKKGAKLINEDMKEAASNEDYDRAAALRDLGKNINETINKNKSNERSN
jgi:hypothetical protein